MALQKYQTPKLSENSVMNACKDPVLKLNETFGKVFYNSSVVTGVHNKCCFKVSIQVNGKYFSATGTTLKLAKQSCALAALADFFFYDVSVPVSSVKKLYKEDVLIQHKKENVAEYIVGSIQKHKTMTADAKKKKMSILGAIHKNEPLTIEEITDDSKQDQNNSPRKPKVLQNINNFITKTNSNLKFPAMKSCLKYPASSNFKVDCKTISLSSEKPFFKDVSDKIHLSSDLGCMLSNKLMARQVGKKTIKAQKVSTVDVGNVQTLEMKLCIKSFARNPIHIDDPQTTLIEEIVNESNVNHEQQVSVAQKKRRRDDSPESNELPAAKRLATYVSKISGQFNRKNRCQQNANVLANLEQLYSNLEFTLEAEMGSLLVPYFMVSAMVGRRKFFGHGKTKQLAQKDSATQILKYLETNPNEVNDIAFRSQTNNTNTYEMCNNPKNVENSSMQLPSYFADIIEAKIMNKFEELTSGRQEICKYKVLAAVVMTFNMNFEQAEVVSIATGTKCINGGNICCNGSVLNDSHAEIIAKRCLMKFLYTQLKWHCNLNSMGESIFQRNPNGLQIPYSLKPNIRFHLYINTAPCGDARIFCFSSNNNNNIRQTSFNSGQYGQLRTKVEGDSGTTPVGTRYYPQTWDGVVLGEPLLTMSCSDKIARWNVVGLQGALLSQLVEPIYFHSIVLGSMFNGEHLYRGICGRIEHYLGHLPLPYRLNRPLLGRTSRPLPRNTNKAPSIGINWTLGDDDIEIISLPTGRRIYNGISFLSKQTFFYKFNYLCNNLPNKGCASMCNNYAEAKENSKDFQIAKNELIAAFYRAGLGTWVRKPIEQNAFMMNMS